MNLQSWDANVENYSAKSTQLLVRNPPPRYPTLTSENAILGGGLFSATACSGR